LEPLAASTPPGPDRADVLHRLGDARFLLGDERAEATLAEALGEEGLGDPARASILRALAATAVSAGKLERAEELAERSLDLAERDAGREMLGPALATLARVRQLLGRKGQRALLDRAVELADAAGAGAVSDLPSRTLVQELAVSGRPDEARSTLAELLELANERGDEDSAAELSTDRARLELAAGRWDEALATVEHAIGLGGSSPVRLAVRAHVLACGGRIDAARADAAASLASRPWDVVAALLAQAALGFVELSESNAAGAIDHLAPAWELLRGSGIGEPAIFPFVADQIEALIELGRADEADAIVDWLEDRGRALSRPWAVAAAVRSRGLVAAATGALTVGLASLEDAVPLHESLAMPFELARTLLALGSVRRRAKQKRPAREILERSLAIFEELGAPLWAERVRAEIARIAGRRPKGQLTEAEVRVARLAAAGRTNREIAGALFMSVRTVEGHLSNAYRKLELRSRTELALFFDSTD
jgi:DNA-binding CsgD family transcriptional regulator